MDGLLRFGGNERCILDLSVTVPARANARTLQWRSRQSISSQHMHAESWEHARDQWRRIDANQ